VLNHTVPHFPLYLGSALVVEGAFLRLGTRRPLRLALVTGALVGTVGLISELGWVTLWGFSTSARLPAALALKIAILGPIAAIAAALVGTALGGAIAKAHERIPAAVLAAAGVALLGTLAFPLPRDVGPVTATIRLEQIGSMANVDVTLEPADAARTATAFALSSWQGGATVSADLKQVSVGRYVSSRPVPVTGTWKTMVSLQRGDEVMAAPVYLPADPEIGAPEVPALPERTERFVRNTTILLREVRGGPPGAAVAAYSGLAVVAAIYIALIAFTARQVPPVGSAASSDPSDRKAPAAWATAARA